MTRSYYGLALPEDGAEQFRDLYSTAEALEQKNPVMQIGKDEVRLGDITVMNLSGAETLGQRFPDRASAGSSAAGHLRYRR